MKARGAGALASNRRTGVVRQKDPMGCGIACVASLLGVSYAYAKRRYFIGVPGRPEVLGRSNGFTRSAIVQALSNAGLRYRRSRVIADLSPGCIVFVRGHLYLVGHYLLRTSAGWMDPDTGAILRKLPDVARSSVVPRLA
jgi:hypothetical protein